MSGELATTPELLELAQDDIVNALAFAREDGCQKPLNFFEKWVIYWAAYRSGKPIQGIYKEAVIATGYGWPAQLVARAIEDSEAFDATGFDFWLDSRGWVSHYKDRCREEFLRDIA